jgi:hypothetical protein
MLEQVAHWNDFSPELRKKIEKELESYGRFVRFKFDIGKTNPDVTKYNGPEVWPFLYTLDPVTYNVTDKDEKRENKSKLKKVGIVSGVDEKGLPNQFKRVRLKEGQRGQIQFDTEKPEDVEVVVYLMLHPKNNGGLFQNPEQRPVFARVDEAKYATEKRTERTAKIKAQNAAMEMSEKDVRDFADAMMWVSTDELSVLRNRVEELAENSPVFFNELVEGKNVEYQAAVKKAMDKKIISFDPAEYKYIWCANQQPIVVLTPVADKNEVQRMAEWLMTGGEPAYKKLKELLK